MDDLSVRTDAVWHHRSTGPGMRQEVGFGDRSTGRGIFGSEFGARHCNQCGLYGVRVRQRRDAALFPNYFGQTCFILFTAAVQLCKWRYTNSFCDCNCEEASVEFDLVQGRRQ